MARTALRPNWCQARAGGNARQWGLHRCRTAVVGALQQEALENQDISNRDQLFQGVGRGQFTGRVVLADLDMSEPNPGLMK